MMEHIPEKKYPVNAKDYKLYEEVGDGVSASVYRALCIPFNEIVAIKVLDLEKCNNDLDGIRREVQTMSLIAHANLLKAHCSFTTGHHLWLVMPYMAGGSCLHIMKSSYSEGFEEPVIATLLRETLCALGYLHKQGHIHRDVKAGNILLDSNGTIKLADFGVSACMFDTGDRQRSRNTFVGTPCWMAPEVMQQLRGYDFRADIWSFGITALELAHGHAPFSKYPPMKVLLMTLQNAPPGLDYERDKRFSKSFKDLVAACLVKDPKKRPTSEKLLKHSFFKHAKSPDYLRRTILEGLPPLGERFKMLKAREAELLQNKDVYGDKEQLSQQEYIRGISAWNFNLEDLKNQAASIQDDDSISGSEKPDASRKLKQKYDYVSVYRDRQSPTNAHNAASELEDEFDDVENLEGSLASFPIQPLQALKGYFDVGEDDSNGKSPSWKLSSDTEMQSPSNEEKRRTGRTLGDNLSSYAQPQHAVSELKNVSSGPLLSENVNTSEKHMGNGERELHARYPADKYYSGNLQYHHRRGINNNTSAEDESEEVVFRHKGRFKVTSANLSPKISTSNVGPFSGSTGQYLSIPSILPTLQCILQQNNMQREELIKLIKLIEESSGNLIEAADSATNDLSQMSPASAREGELMALLVQLEQRVGSLVEELQNLKLKNAQLELQVQLSVIGEKEERAA